MSTLEALRRAHPTVDSPLGDLISRKIGVDEYVRRTNAHRTRDGLPPMHRDEIAQMREIHGRHT